MKNENVTYFSRIMTIIIHTESIIADNSKCNTHMQESFLSF